MDKDLKKLKKDELIELVHQLKNEQNTDEVQELKNENEELKEEQEFIIRGLGVEDKTDLMLTLMNFASCGQTVKSVAQDNYKLKEVLKENERLKKEVQKLKDERTKMINEYKENKGVQKIKNERNAGRKSKFTDTDIDKILKSRATGTKIRHLAAHYNCSVGLIHKIINEHNENKK